MKLASLPFSKWNLFRFEYTDPRQKEPVTIAGDALMATAEMAEGKMVPVIILDTSKRPDIDELILVHEHTGPGDVESAWARFVAKKTIINLVLMFKHPVPNVLKIEFEVVKHGALIDRVLMAEALYLQGGRPGARLSNTLECPRIIVEVPAHEFAQAWPKMRREALVRHGRKRLGLSRKEAEEFASQVIAEWRKFTSMRITERGMVGGEE